MSPLIEDARRRQKRRRMAVAVFLLLAAGVASVLALVRHPAPQRQAQSTTRPAALWRYPSQERAVVIPLTMLRTLVFRHDHGRGASVTLNPRTGAILVTTVRR